MGETAYALLAEVRNYLDITWDDPCLDDKLLGIITRGMTYLNELTGSNLDYSAEGRPKELLLDYVRYVRSDALEKFAANFAKELLGLQISEEVARYEPSNPDV